MCPSFFVSLETTMFASPSLDSKNWIVEPGEYLDKLFTYYTASNYHQTLLFKGQVLSMQKAIFECGTNMDQLAAKLQADLTSLCARSFPEGYRVEVSIDESDGAWENLTKINFFISMSVKKGGVNYDLQKQISSSDSVFKNFQSAVGI